MVKVRFLRVYYQHVQVVSCAYTPNKVQSIFFLQSEQSDHQYTQLKDIKASQTPGVNMEYMYTIINTSMQCHSGDAYAYVHKKKIYTYIYVYIYIYTRRTGPWHGVQAQWPRCGHSLAQAFQACPWLPDCRSLNNSAAGGWSLTMVLPVARWSPPCEVFFWGGRGSDSFKLNPPKKEVS